MIVGTAGHVDHGKSALVEALTGRRMDRLAEERRRGITIDLNFAPLDLGDGRIAGVIDVPGHEDFVRTMAAGASGVDVALLVVAADDGIMPQTREHLALLELLGVPRGIPVITKTDLAEPGWVDLLADEVAALLAGSRIRWQPPHRVSVRTSEGVEALRHELARQQEGDRAAARADLLRLPVDRAFTVAGTGTVVTGTIWSGEVGVGDIVRLLPGDREVRVRSIECFGVSVTRAGAGARAALALAGADPADAARGTTVVSPQGPLRATGRCEAWCTVLPAAAHALADGTRVRLLHGTGEVLARVRLATPIAPGAGGVARLVLERPAALRGGDRFALRSYSPVTTIGGGVVLDPDPPAGPVDHRTLASEQLPERLAVLVARRRRGLAIADVPLVVPVAPAGVAALVAGLPASVVLADRVYAAAVVEGAADRVVQAVRAHHAAAPTEHGLGLAEARRAAGLAEAAAARLLEQLRAERRLRIDGHVAALPGFAPRPAVQGEAVELVVAHLRQAALAIPTVAELARDLNLGDALRAARQAERDGHLVAIDQERFTTPEHVATLEQVLRELGAAGPITPGGLRDRLGLSRKFLMPLLEWADRRRLTVRHGNERRLTPH